MGYSYVVGFLVLGVVVTPVTVLLSVDVQNLLVVGKLDRLTELAVHVLGTVVDVMILSAWVDRLEQLLMNFWLLSAK